MGLCTAHTEPLSCLPAPCFQPHTSTCFGERASNAINGGGGSGPVMFTRGLSMETSLPWGSFGCSKS